MTPTTPFVDTGTYVVFGGKVTNYGGEVFGPNDFTTALTLSINTTFGKVGNLLQRKRLEATMQRFGFYQTPPLPLPAGEVVPSGRYGNKGLCRPTPSWTRCAVAWAAVGQEKLLATPLQMALVAGGRGQRRRDHEAVLHAAGHRALRGAWSQRAQPQQWKVAMKPAVAAELNTMMQRVVNAGTGHRGGAAGHPGRRQDRHGGERRRDEPGVVHRLRAGRRPQDRDRGRDRGHSIDRRRGGGAARRRRHQDGPGADRPAMTAGSRRRGSYLTEKERGNNT